MTYPSVHFSHSVFSSIIVDNVTDMAVQEELCREEQVSMILSDSASDEQPSVAINLLITLSYTSGLQSIESE